MANESTAVAVQAKPRTSIVVEDSIDIFDTAKFEHMGRVALMMARASLLPEHLQGPDLESTAGNCLMIVEQASVWKMSPLALARASYFLQGKLGYEGKVIQAVAERQLGSGFQVEYSGAGEDRRITLTNRHPYLGTPVSVSGTVRQWRTKEKGGAVKGNWLGDPDKQLRYRGVPEWCRHYAPHIIMGVYTEDELSDMQEEFADRQKGRQFVEIPSAKMPGEIPGAVEPAQLEGRVNPERTASDVRQTGAPYGGQAKAEAKAEVVDAETGEISVGKATAEPMPDNLVRDKQAGENALAGDHRAEAQRQEREEPGSSVAPTGAAATAGSHLVEENPAEGERVWGPEDWQRNHAEFRDALPAIASEEELVELLTIHDVDGMPAEWSTALQNLFNDAMERIRAKGAPELVQRVAEGAPSVDKATAAKSGEEQSSSAKPAEPEKPTGKPPARSFGLLRSQLRAAESSREVEGMWSQYVVGFAYSDSELVELAAIRQEKIAAFGPPRPTVTKMRYLIENATPNEGETAGACLDRVWGEVVEPHAARMDPEDVAALRDAAVARGKALSKTKRQSKKQDAPAS